MACGKSFSSSFERANAQAAANAGELAALRLKSKLEEERDIRAETRAEDKLEKRNRDYLTNVVGFDKKQIDSLGNLLRTTEDMDELTSFVNKKTAAEKLRGGKAMSGPSKAHTVCR